MSWLRNEKVVVSFIYGKPFTFDTKTANVLNLLFLVILDKETPKIRYMNVCMNFFTLLYFFNAVFPNNKNASLSYTHLIIVSSSLFDIRIIQDLGQSDFYQDN